MISVLKQKRKEFEELTKTETLDAKTVRILAMDDEKVIRELYHKILSRSGHKVDCAKDGVEALRLFEEAKDSGYRYDVVILDLAVEAGMRGEDTLARLREIDPKVRAVVCSGYTDSSLMADCIPHGFEAALSKPFRPAELDQAVCKALLARVVSAQH